MKCLRLAALAAIVMLTLPDVASAQRQWRFRPQAANVLGTPKARTPITFTRVFTQEAGELGLARTQEHYINLEPNWLKIGIGAFFNPELVIGYISITWADEVVRVTCFLERAKSDLLRGQFFITMRATEGTIGAVPVGTVVGTSVGRAFAEAGVSVIKADVDWTPGIFPEVLPTSFNMAHQLVPELWLTGGSGHVIALHTFTSVHPPDGSLPLIYLVQEGIPIQ
jgi:hypothetical protein